MKIGRNDPCPCKSGRKFKRCCGVGTTDSTNVPSQHTQRTNALAADQSHKLAPGVYAAIATRQRTCSGSCKLPLASGTTVVRGCGGGIAADELHVRFVAVDGDVRVCAACWFRQSNMLLADASGMLGGGNVDVGNISASDDGTVDLVSPTDGTADVSTAYDADATVVTL